MATYGSYRKIAKDQIPDNSVGGDLLADGAGNAYCSFWIYPERGFRCHACANNGGCVCQACGRCCNWTVPSNTTGVTFEIWSGGGGGAGSSCCNCFPKGIGGAGGNYAIKSISTNPGCTYTVCAGGSWPCEQSETCSASGGCKSFVQGQGLSNFCVVGGCGGWFCIGEDNDPRTPMTCANCNICGMFGSDFGMMASTGMENGSDCQCMQADFTYAAAGAGIGNWSVQAMTETWCRCGCYVNWPAGGGINGNSSYCGDDDMCEKDGMGMGGSGIVKITYS